MTLTAQEKHDIGLIVDQLKKEREKTPMPPIEPKTRTTPPGPTADDLLKALLKHLNPTGPTTTTSAAPPATSDRTQIAQLMMTAQKNITLLCIMLFTLPILCVMITMINLDMIAGSIALAAVIYPAFLFAQSTKTQAYLAQKYHLKPAFILRQPAPRPQQTNRKQKEETFI